MDYYVDEVDGKYLTKADLWVGFDDALKRTFNNNFDDYIQGLIDNELIHSVSKQEYQRHMKQTSWMDETEEIAQRMVSYFNHQGNDMYTEDEVQEQFALACEEIFDIDDVWEYNDNGIFGIDVSDLYSDVLLTISYEGWGTIFEGPYEGGVTNDLDKYETI